VNPFKHFGRASLTGDRPIARPLPTQESRTQKNADMHPWIERGSITRFQCSSSPKHTRLRPRCLRDWHLLFISLQTR